MDKSLLRRQLEAEETAALLSNGEESDYSVDGALDDHVLLPLFHRRSPSPRSRIRHSSSWYPLRFLQKTSTWTRALVLIFFVVACVRFRVYWSIAKPWLLSPTHYHPTLQQTIVSAFPPSMQHDLLLSLHSPSFGVNSTIPPELYQTDRERPTPDDERTWARHGFNQHFLDDDEAALWVEEHFGGSLIAKTYRELPIPILKADFLRYLLVLVNGGVYSDVDTRALAPIAKWASDVTAWPDPNASLPEPRIIVGIEGGARAWRDVAGMVDFTGLKRPTRHRFFQFAQWTFAAKSLHPIFVDATRRIIDGVALAHAWNVTQEAKIEQLEARGYWQKAHHIRDSMVHPWEVETFRDRLTVQEWTGPAAFTDSVLSYLLAVAGVRAEDLYWVNKPIQIADVVILPMDGFNPILSQLPRPKARVAHLFRGSWKKNWAGEDSWEPEAEDPTSQTNRPTSASIPSTPYPTPLGRLSGSINLNE